MGDKADIIYQVQTKWKDISPSILILSSSTFYFFEQLISHPLEVIRTRVQINQQKLNYQTLKAIISGAGVRNLYTAFWPGSVGYMPGNVVYLLTYSWAKDRFQAIYDEKYMHVSNGRQVPVVTFAAAICADIAAVSLFCPVEVVVQRFFVQNFNNKKYLNTKDAIQKIFREEGIRGFYKGFATILVNSVPASALWWTIYEQTKTYLSKQTETNQSKESTSNEQVVVRKGWISEMIGGAIAGLIVTFFSNPLDVIRTRLQTQDIDSHDYSGNPIKKVKYNGPRDAFKSILRDEGAGAFFKGIGPRCLQYMIWSSLGALGYEMCVDLSTKKHIEDL